MLATIEKVEDGYIARFERLFEHPVEQVWAALTENEILEKWMPNLQVKDLRKGGTIHFDMKDGSGTLIDMEILDFKPLSVLEFIWGADRVRFELSEKPDGCLLVLNEWIGTLTDHTPKDLAGWHVCLDVLKALLNGHVMDFPKGEWEEWHKKYVMTINRIQN
ncbi:SRPBCC family protein [Fictibacillus sp. Mic-4]|uniref:SRPBCC family protein n=1 Tax=Fictibacillus TaxID=1329200 RepID=UPI00040C01BE|nr:SRPBCC family protein [Fictibacillus gelatini]